jgi:hypothetical protein
MLAFALKAGGPHARVSSADSRIGSPHSATSLTMGCGSGLCRSSCELAARLDCDQLEWRGQHDRRQCGPAPMPGQPQRIDAPDDAAHRVLRRFRCHPLPHLRQRMEPYQGELPTHGLSGGACQPPFRPRTYQSPSPARWSASRSASATITSVGLAKPDVGKVAAPATNRPRTPNTSPSAFTTPSSGERPMRAVPMW